MPLIFLILCSHSTSWLHTSGLVAQCLALGMVCNLNLYYDLFELANQIAQFQADK